MRENFGQRVCGRARGIHTVVDTCGYADPELMRRIGEALGISADGKTITFNLRERLVELARAKRVPVFGINTARKPSK